MELIKPRSIYQEVSKIISIPPSISKRQQKRGFPLLDILAYNRLERTSKRHSKKGLEYLPYTKQSLEDAYDFIFDGQDALDGDLIFASYFYWEKGGVKMQASESREFFINNHLDIFESYPDFRNDCFFFFFIQAGRILYYEHVDTAYEIICN